jgi:hypothetical protein
MPVVSMRLIRRSINAQGRCRVQRAVKSDRTKNVAERDIFAALPLA